MMIIKFSNFSTVFSKNRKRLPRNTEELKNDKHREIDFSHLVATPKTTVAQRLDVVIYSFISSII